MTEPATIDAIRDYHAHVYFDAAEKPAALKLLDAVEARFDVAVGRKHDDPVGPHPKGSCQITFVSALFAEIVPWLALNHGGLTVFVHPNTGDDLRDHRDRAIWIGRQETLDLSLFD